MERVLLAAAVAVVAVAAATYMHPLLAVVAGAAALWLAFECCGLAHWYVGLHPEAVRVHYNLQWASGV
jgi:hypothetical protein